jgi:hypothetical protein
MKILGRARPKMAVGRSSEAILSCSFYEILNEAQKFPREEGEGEAPITRLPWLARRRGQCVRAAAARALCACCAAGYANQGLHWLSGVFLKPDIGQAM